MTLAAAPPLTVPFPLLAEPGRYVAPAWDLTVEHDRRAYWLGLFRGHFPSLLDEARKVLREEATPEPEVERRLRQCRQEFEQYLDQVTQRPDRFGRLDILEVCKVREAVLRRAQIGDPYRLSKARENATSLALLPALLRDLDAAPPGERALRVVHGVFAGNIFDLGATATAALFKDASVDFHAVRRQLRPRPWLIDDLDAWLERFHRLPRHRAAVLFVDNAGSDIVLGMLPLARELLRQGTHVILTANSTPSLNDVTHGELTALVHGVGAWDALVGDAMRDQRLELVPSGNGLPLIDLRHVSPELAAAVHRRGVDLVVLEGMGRALESNLDARLRCDALKIAMIKDHGVAEALGGQVYDLVLRFDAA